MIRPWIQTFSGRKFYVLAPHKDDICLADIAHHLSMLCRFTGAPKDFYSVAQHSCLVAFLLEDYGPRLALLGLLHDAAEAYTGDMNRPLKHSGEMGKFIFISNEIQRCVHDYFGLHVSAEDHALIKDADNMALAAEARDLMNPRADWGLSNLPNPAMVPTIKPLSPTRARAAFLRAFERYSKQMKMQHERKEIHESI